MVTENGQYLIFCLIAVEQYLIVPTAPAHGLTSS